MSSQLNGIDQNIQLIVSINLPGTFTGNIPCRDFEFTLNGEKVEIDTLYAANVGWHYRIPRFNFSLTLYQMGGLEPETVLEMFAKGLEFSIQVMKYKGNATWEFTNLTWNHAIFTSVRGSGMSPDQIPIISVTAKALEMVTKDGKVYGHQLVPD